MYSVFLIDDEELVVKSLMASVDWASHGFSVVGYSLSGAEALEAIAEVNPDVIFTDIRMPGMSGLELIKQLKEASCQALMIVISGYAEFALAQKAINYGAFGYCLKPFDDIEIESFLRKARTVLKERYHQGDLDFLALLESNLLEDKRRLIEVIHSVDINLDSIEGMKVIVSIGTSNMHLMLHNNSISFRIGLEKIAYLVSGNTSLSVQSLYLENIYKIKGIGMSERFHEIGKIKEAIWEAEIYAYQYFVMDNMPEFKTRHNRNATHLLKSLEQAISQNNLESINLALEKLITNYQESELQITDALQVYNQTMKFIYRDESSIDEDYMYSFEQLTATFNHVSDMLKSLQILVLEKCKRRTKGVEQGAGNRTFNAIRSYIDEHFREELTIPLLAKLFNINGNYISQLFKKEIETTFTEYLACLRIEFACKILLSTDLPIGEVAEKSGYSDYFYFSRIFKRMKGITPSAYRNNRNSSLR